jgi:putative addiction module component (TIGR02574 family)
VPAQIPAMVRPAFDIQQLTVPERLELIAELWASLAARPDGLALSAAERDVVRARLAEDDAHPEAAVPWETVRAELAAEQAADDADPERGPSRFEAAPKRGA